MQNIKKIYLYAVSLIALVIMVIGGITLINLGLKAWVFTKADRNYYVVPCDQQPMPADAAMMPKCDPERDAKYERDQRTAQRQNEASHALAMLIIATPVFYYHWKLARKEV